MQAKIKELVIPKEFMEAEWQTNKVKVRKWNLRIRNEINDEISDTKFVGKVVSSKLNEGYGQILIITKCVIEAPWRVGDTNATGELDPDFGDWLFKEISLLSESGKPNPQDSEESSKEKPVEPIKNVPQ